MIEDDEVPNLFRDVTEDPVRDMMRDKGVRMGDTWFIVLVFNGIAFQNIFE